jgi:large subunit ribosomal protein L18
VSRQKTLARRRTNRAFRVRKRVRGTASRPRVTVLRTNLHFYAQIIDDDAGRTLCSASSKSLELAYGGNVAAAKKVGEALAEKAKGLQIQQACLDRGSYKFHGRVKALVDALRAAGLQL